MSGSEAPVPLTCGRRRWLGLLAALLVTTAGVAFWFMYVKPMTPARISRSFPAEGIKKIILRAAAAESSGVTTDPAAGAVEVSGLPIGGAEGYHPPDLFWRETPAAKWGLDFVSARHGEVLVISTKNEIHYIHHVYLLRSIALRVPAGVEVVLEPRKLSGDGGPDLQAPKR